MSLLTCSSGISWMGGREDRGGVEGGGRLYWSREKIKENGSQDT